MKNEFLICLIILSSCQGKTNNTKVKTTSQVDSFRNSLIGKWGGLKESNPVWKITHDSIYYYGQDKSYAYEVEGNDLVWEFDSSQVRLKNHCRREPPGLLRWDGSTPGILRLRR